MWFRKSEAKPVGICACTELTTRQSTALAQRRRVSHIPVEIRYAKGKGS